MNESLNQAQLFAHYNQRMNQQVIQIVSTLSPDTIRADKGAFFHSILGTLNHILVGDLLWLKRFYDHDPKRFSALAFLNELPKPQSLNEILYDDLTDFIPARELVDNQLIEWLEQKVTNKDMHHGLSYKNSKGETHKKSFALVLAHLFNHQTHHRGQLTTLLSQLHVDVGPTDFIYDIPEWA